MRVGVFTPLLSNLPLDEVLKKLAKYDIRTVELGTGNYPGDSHCKLSMLESNTELADFKKKLDDHGVSISALSSHGNPLHPDASRARFVSTLRMFGYDYVLSIEHEDSLMSAEEGLSKAASFLGGLVIKEQPGAAWWV